MELVVIDEQGLEERANQWRVKQERPKLVSIILHNNAKLELKRTKSSWPETTGPLATSRLYPVSSGTRSTTGSSDTWTKAAAMMMHMAILSVRAIVVVSLSAFFAATMGLEAPSTTLGLVFFAGFAGEDIDHDERTI
jgi:hypothetical protein